MCVVLSNKVIIDYLYKRFVMSKNIDILLSLHVYQFQNKPLYSSKQGYHSCNIKTGRSNGYFGFRPLSAAKQEVPFLSDRPIVLGRSSESSKQEDALQDNNSNPPPNE